MWATAILVGGDARTWLVVGGLFGLALGALFGGLFSSAQARQVPPPIEEGSMRCQVCGVKAVLHITTARKRVAVEERHLCEHHASEYMQAPLPPGHEIEWKLSSARGRSEGIIAAPGVTGVAGSTSRPRSEQELGIDLVRVIISEVDEQQVLVLQEAGGARWFGLVCGIFEATTLDRALKGLSVPRPLTHDAWIATITALGGTVEGIWLTDLREQIYYAEARIRQGEQLRAVDLRPSDAIILALKCAVPILIPDWLMAMISTTDDG
jgi:bifunctional DNase/RNase